jgi:hypothetical protein
MMREFLARIPLGVLVIACLTIGLAPFNPPHIWEKLNMLVRMELTRPIDWLDLLFHGIPWVLLILKLTFGR